MVLVVGGVDDIGRTGGGEEWCCVESGKFTISVTDIS